MVGGVRGVAFVVFQRHLRDEAAFLVDVEAAVGAAVAVVLHGFNAAVLAVPDGFAGGVVAVEVVRVGVFFEDEGRGLWGVAVLVVVLDDAAAVSGVAQCFAVVTAGCGLAGRAAVGGEVPGCGDARRRGQCIDGDFGFFGLRGFCRFCGGEGWRFGIDDGGGKAEGEQDDGDLDHVGSPFGGRGIIAGLCAVAMMIR